MFEILRVGSGQEVFKSHVFRSDPREVIRPVECPGYYDRYRAGSVASFEFFYRKPLVTNECDFLMLAQGSFCGLGNKHNPPPPNFHTSAKATLFFIQVKRINIQLLLTPLEPPKSLPVLNSSKFVQEKGFPVVKTLKPIFHGPP